MIFSSNKLDGLLRETKIYLIIFLVLVAGFFFWNWQGEPRGQVGGIAIASQSEFPKAEDKVVLHPERRGESPDPLLTARSVLVRDQVTGEIIYELDSLRVVPIASLTKLMTAVVVYNNLDMDKTVVVSGEDLKVPQYKADLLSGERITARELVKAMLISSANDAAMVLARETGGSVEKFVEMMNKEAELLGMYNTHFANPVGLDDPGHYSTARDLSLLVEEFLSYPELVEFSGTKTGKAYSADGRFTHSLTNTNKLLFNHKEVVGLKTGYTTEAKGNLIVMVNDGSVRYYAIVLGSDEREVDTEAVLAWIKNNFVWK